MAPLLLLTLEMLPRLARGLEGLGFLTPVWHPDLGSHPEILQGQERTSGWELGGQGRGRGGGPAVLPGGGPRPQPSPVYGSSSLNGVGT